LNVERSFDQVISSQEGPMHLRSSSSAGLLFTLALLALGCQAEEITEFATGQLTVVTTTAGDEPDPDGYTVQVDEGGPQPIGANGQLQLNGLSSGDYSVTLSGIAANCSAAEGLSQTVTVSEGAPTMASFTLTCSATSGALEISIVTTGESLDPDGFELQVDNLTPTPISTAGSFTANVFGVGPHTVKLQKLASNCTVADGTSRTVNVAAGTPAKLQFAVTCSFIGVTIWRSIPLPPSVTPRAVWGTSATDLFVIDDRFRYSTQFISHGSAIWHYDGTAWTEQVSRVDTVLRGIWGSSSTDVYAVGHASSERFGSVVAPVILHYDGIRWSEMPFPVVGEAYLGEVWGTGAGELFVAGSDWSGPRDSPSIELLARFDGSSWSSLEMHDFDLSGGFLDVSGTSGTDVWAVGDRERYRNSDWDAGMIFHYDGSGATQHLSRGMEEYTGVWAIAPNDVWVVGTYEDPVTSPYGVVVHYDGSGWSRTEPPSISNLNDVWGSSSNDVYAVGSAVLHFNGTSWSKISDQGGYRVWGTSRNDVFILRDNEILHGKP
jgi:hypothetical protein